MSFGSSKLPKVGESIFTEMTALANSVGAINLSQGFPGFDPDPVLTDLLAKYSAEGKNQYAPASGIPELRKQLALKYSCDFDLEVTVTSGASEALFSAIAAVVGVGDEVIIIEPAYDLYLPAILLQGGLPVFVKMKYPDFSIDWTEVWDRITSKTKLIIVNTPHNPTGKVLKNQDLIALESIVRKHDQIYIVSDEVYEHIVFDSAKHLSLRDNDFLKERTFLCSSFAKTYHITGWKVGYCIAPTALTAEFRKIHQYITFCTFTPAQYALANYMENSKVVEQLSGFYERKRNLFARALAASKFELLISEGTFFQNVSYRHLSEMSDREASRMLTEKTGVASISVSAFYEDKTDHRILRFCFAKDDSILIEAAERLQKASGYL